METTNYSGAQGTLNEVNSIFNIYKRFAKEVPIETSLNADGRDLLEMNKMVLVELSSEMDFRMKHT